jgi:hypothetical protein
MKNTIGSAMSAAARVRVRMPPGGQATIARPFFIVSA